MISCSQEIKKEGSHEKHLKIKTRVSKDNKACQAIATDNDEDVVKPLRFLAQIAVETKTNNRLLKKQHQIGFCIGTR